MMNKLKKTSLMKNVSLIIAVAMIAVFGVISCSPPSVDVAKPSWREVNGDKDPTKGGDQDISDLTPDGYIYFDGQKTDAGKITELEVNLSFPPEADVLRGEIKTASLNFVTFHSFTKAATALLDADTLGDAIPFEFVKRNRDTVTVKLTTSIDTGAAYSQIIAKFDGKYTVNHGIRLDVDQNGKFEDIYDDVYTTISGLVGATITGFVRPGQQPGNAIDILLHPVGNGVPNGNIISVTAATPNLAVGTFEFVGKAQTTNSNTLEVAYVGYSNDPATATARNAWYADMGGKLASGIKLQKLSDKTWTDVATAVYDGTAASATVGYIVFKDVTFDHLGTYRIVWKGSAYTETDNAYFGVKQRLYIDNGSPPRAGRYTRTEVVGDALIGYGVLDEQHITVFNPDVVTYIEAFGGIGAGFERVSFDAEDKNNVVKIELANAPSFNNKQFFWNTVSLADFKKSFQIVYRQNGGVPSADSDDLVYVDVKAIEFKEEFVTAPNPSGNNVLYITVDPNFKLTQQLGSSIRFRINNGLTLTDKATTSPQTLTFGDANTLTGNWVFYQPGGGGGQPPQYPPAAPTGVQAAAMSSTSIRISWTAVSGADYYLIYDDDDNYIDMVYSSPYTVAGLNPDTEYHYYVVAVNNEGPSQKSATVNATTLPLPPTGTPNITNFSQTNDNVLTVEWDAVTGADSYTIVVYVNGNYGYTETRSGLSYVATGVPASMYTVSVYATNDGGDGPQASNAITILTGSVWADGDGNTITFTDRMAYLYEYDGQSSPDEQGMYFCDQDGELVFSTSTNTDVLYDEEVTVSFTGLQPASGTFTLSDGTTTFTLQP